MNATVLILCGWKHGTNPEPEQLYFGRDGVALEAAAKKAAESGAYQKITEWRNPQNGRPRDVVWQPIVHVKPTEPRGVPQTEAPATVVKIQEIVSESQKKAVEKREVQKAADQQRTKGHADAISLLSKTRSELLELAKVEGVTLSVNPKNTEIISAILESRANPKPAANPPAPETAPIEAAPVAAS